MVTQRCQTCERNRNPKFFKSTLGRVCLPCQKKNRARSARNAHLINTYGITLEEYDRILEAQGGHCAICHGVRKVYDVDHNHELVRLGYSMRASVRGLLCRRCNRRLLPAAQDNIDVLNRASHYVWLPPAVLVLKEAA